MVDVYWETTPVSDAVAPGYLLGLNGHFNEAMELLGLPQCGEDTTKIFELGDVEMIVEAGYALNTINPETVEGGGIIHDLAKTDRSLAMLVLIYVQQKMDVNMPGFVLLADMSGQVLSLKKWSDIAGFFKDAVGIHLDDDLLESAGLLGLRPKPLELDSPDIEDAWF